MTVSMKSVLPGLCLKSRRYWRNAEPKGVGRQGVARKSLFGFFSVQPLCALCLCGCFFRAIMNHRGTEHTEVAQRRACMPLFRAKPVKAISYDFIYQTGFASKVSTRFNSDL